MDYNGDTDSETGAGSATGEKGAAQGRAFPF